MNAVNSKNTDHDYDNSEVRHGPATIVCWIKHTQKLVQVLKSFDEWLDVL